MVLPIPNQAHSRANGQQYDAFPNILQKSFKWVKYCHPRGTWYKSARALKFFGSFYSDLLPQNQQRSINIKKWVFRHPTLGIWVCVKSFKSGRQKSFCVRKKCYYKRSHKIIQTLLEGIKKLNKLILTIFKMLPWLCPVIFVLDLLLASLTLTKPEPRHAPSWLVRMTDNNSELTSLCTRVTEVKVKRHEVTSR